MKFFFMAFALFISFSSFAVDVEDTQDIKSKPVPQKQETKPGIDNPYPIGDYDQKGEYNFFDRLEQEKRAAQEEKDEQGN